MADMSSTIGSRRPTFDVTSRMTRRRSLGPHIIDTFEMQVCALRPDSALQMHISTVRRTAMQGRCTTGDMVHHAADGPSLFDLRCSLPRAAVRYGCTSTGTDRGSAA